MPDLMDGFTEDGIAVETGESSFDQQLAAAAGKSDDGGKSAPEPSTADPALTTGQEIVRGLLDSSSDPLSFDVQVTDDPQPAPKEIELEFSGQRDIYSAREIEATISEAVQNEERLTELRDAEAGSQFDIDIEAAEGTDDLVAALGNAAYSYVQGDLSGEAYAVFREETLEALASELLEPDENGAFSQAQVDQLGAALDSDVRAFAAQNYVAEIDQALPELVEKAADQRAQEIQAVLTNWRNAQSIKDGNMADWRLKNAEAAYRYANNGAEMGDLFADPNVTPAEMLDVLIEYDARMGSAVKGWHDQEFKQNLLDSTPEFGDGLVVDGIAPPPKVLPAISPGRLSRTVDAFASRDRNVSAASVKANFAGDVGLKDGWTDSKGRKIEKLSEIDGSAAQYRRSEQIRKEQARF